MTTAPRRRLAVEPVAPAPRPAMGHNQPPRPMTAEEVAAGLRDSCADLAARQKEILAGIERFKSKYPVITDDDVQGRAADFAGRTGAIAKWLQLLETRRVTEKEPHLAAERAVDAFFKALTADVTEGRKALIERMTAYANKKEAEARETARREAEAARLRAQEAERLALSTMRPAALEAAIDAHQQAERAQAQAQAPAADLSRVHSANGSVTSLRTAWKFDETQSDLMELAKAVVDGRAPVAYLAFNTTRINYAVRSEKIRAIPGCNIREERSV